jgi:hypothetical protein
VRDKEVYVRRTMTTDTTRNTEEEGEHKTVKRVRTAVTSCVTLQHSVSWTLESLS